MTSIATSSKAHGKEVNCCRCCRCNRTGTCKNCACVRAGQSCGKCLPGGLGKCLNQSAAAQSAAAHSVPTTSLTNPTSPTSRTLSDVANPIVRVPPPANTLDDHAAADRESLTPLAPIPPTHANFPTPDSDGRTDAAGTPALPAFIPMASPIFTWGDLDAETFTQRLNLAYSTVIHWRRNIFAIPTGNAGTAFVRELSRLFRAYATGSALESVALRAAMTICVLLLQKPSRLSKSKDHVACLERRMGPWRAGDLDELLQEGLTIQRRLINSKRKPCSEIEKIRRVFVKEMSKGNTKAALRSLSKDNRGSVLRLSDIVSSPEGAHASVLDTLKAKHPPGGSPTEDSIVNGAHNPPAVHPVIFDSIQGATIHSAALRTSGAAGPSGIDARGWRRLCSSYKSASDDLCHSLALLTRRLCTVFVDPEGLAPLMSCRLIALDKNPGVRPIGICEVVRRIIAKAILSVTSGDIQDAAGSLQLCAGQRSGTEAAVHAMNTVFKDEDCEAVLLVDASNAFNALNRQVALRNIRALCPSIATAVINTYRNDAELFVDGSTLLSQEGTTQGDPLAMPMYALALLPLIEKINPDSSVVQTWYADDASAAGRIGKLRDWWNALVSQGPKFGYHANPLKTHLIVKERHRSTATTVFGDTQIKITSEGRPHLGAALGTTSSFSELYVNCKVERWSEELLLLSSIAQTHPQAAYAAFTHGMASKWVYLARTMENIGSLLQPLEDIIRTKFIPTLCGRPAPNDELRDLLALPCRLGGLGILDPTRMASHEHSASKEITTPIVRSILSHDGRYTHETLADQLSAVAEIRKKKRARSSSHATELKSLLPSELQRAMDLSQEKGASIWLTVLPIEEFGFSLHKGAFRDALALRYNWPLHNIPSTCPCGSQFTVEHALSCPKGGYPTIRHNEIRDFTAHLMTEVCHNVAIEPHLQPLSGETLQEASSNVQDGARLDVAADGFWGSRFERAFFDVRTFNPYAPSNRRSTLQTVYRTHENIKKRAYDQRIREVEHGTFSPLVFSCTGGMSRAATATYKRLAALIAEKRDEPYSTTMGWIRCRISFSLLRASIMCFRGARSSLGRASRQPDAPINLVTSEGHVPQLE